MRRKKLKIFILMALCLILFVSCSNQNTQEKNEPEANSTEVFKNNNDVADTEFENPYDQIIHFINEGDLEKLTEKLVEKDITKKVYEQMEHKDKEAFDIVMRDVLLFCEEFNDAETIVKLRTKGFVSDEVFEEYWVVLEYNPARDELANGIDTYLVYELERFMKKEINDDNFLKELYGLGLLDETFQDELENRLQ